MKLECHTLLSTFAFKFNLRRYSLRLQSVTAITNACHGGVDGEGPVGEGGGGEGAAGGQLVAADGGKHRSALAKAAADGDVQTIAALIEVGADPNKVRRCRLNLCNPC